MQLSTPPNIHSTKILYTNFMSHMIREYTHEDVEGIKKCLIDLQEFERMMDPQRLRGIEIAEEYLRHLLELCEEDKGKIFVVELNGNIIGMISVYIEEDTKHMRQSKHSARISDLIVLPEYKNKGITKELLEKAESYAVSKGMKHIEVAVLSVHGEGIEGYQRNGYHQYEIILKKNI